MLTYGILTTGRQDWGILRSLAVGLSREPGHEVVVLAGGMACSPQHGEVAAIIERDGLPVRRLPWTLGDPARECADATVLVAEALRALRPRALVLAGDRYETLAAAQAATLALVPIVHLHGGEETQGAFDDAIRHAVTKLSHLHFTSHPAHAARVLQMGEAPDTVHVVGAPGLDNLRRDDLASREELEAHLGLPLAAPVVVVTLHPTTLGKEGDAELRAVLAAMSAVPATYVVTLPNADPGNVPIRAALTAACDAPGRRAVDALGERRYLGLLRAADAMLGNSSSGILEAPALGLPVVNVGDRQKGRVRGDNVIDVPPFDDEVVAALRRALDPSFRRTLDPARAPFGDGRAAEKMLHVLRGFSPGEPPTKRFVTMVGAAPRG